MSASYDDRQMTEVHFWGDSHQFRFADRAATGVTCPVGPRREIGGGPKTWWYTMIGAGGTQRSRADTEAARLAAEQVRGLGEPPAYALNARSAGFGPRMLNILYAEFRRPAPVTPKTVDTSHAPWLAREAPQPAIEGGWQSSSFTSYETPAGERPPTVRDALQTRQLHRRGLHSQRV